MGCRAFTPPLVGLAKELEGQPFHLLASHNQNGSLDAAQHEIYQNGLHPLSPNVTVAKSAGHPGVTGTGYVPYYLVFDHHGDLAYHHQGGPYHGGDGNAVHDRVRNMLTQVPVVYVGKDTFSKYSKLAKELEKGKNLKRSFAALAAALEKTPEDPELQQLDAGVTLYRDRLIVQTTQELAVNPKEARKDLKAAIKDFAATPWVEPLQALQVQLQDRANAKQHDASSKALRAAIAKLEKLEPVQGNAGKVINLVDTEFRSANARDLESIKKALRNIVDKYGETPAAVRAGELLGLLG